MTANDEVSHMGTRMDSNPQFPLGSSFYAAFAQVIDQNEESWKNNVPFKSAGMTTDRWNISLGDLVATPKQSFSHMLNVQSNIGYGTSTYGKLPVIGNVAGVPAALGDAEIVGEDSRDVNNILAEMVVANLRFVGISMGNYRNGGNGVKSPQVDGINLSAMGPNTIMVPMKNGEIEAFSYITMAACPVAHGGASQKTAFRVPLTIEAFEGGTITQRMRTCITAYDTLSQRLAANGDTATTSFHAMLDNQTAGNKVFSQAVNIGHSYAEGAVGLALKMLMIFAGTVKNMPQIVRKIANVSTDQDTGTNVTQYIESTITGSDQSTQIDSLIMVFAEAIGIIPHGSIKPESPEIVEKLSKAIKEEFLSPGLPSHITQSNHINLIVNNAHNNISQAHGELFAQQIQIIGRVLAQAPTSSDYGGGNLRKYHCFFHP